MIESELDALRNIVGLAGAERDILAYAAKLLEKLASGQFGFIHEDELLHVFDGYLDCQQPSKEKLQGHLQVIKLAKKVEACITLCMLCAGASDDYSDKAKHERVTAWSLLACLSLYKINAQAYKGVIQEGARRIRLMTTAKYQWMYKRLPSFDVNVEETYIDFKLIMDALSEEISRAELSESEIGMDMAARKVKKLQSQKTALGHIFALVAHYVKTLPVDEGQADVTDRSVKEGVEVVPVPAAAGLEDDEFKYFECYELASGNVGAITAQEFRRDRSVGAKYVDVKLILPGSINRSRTLAYFRASMMVNRIAMRNMANPCDWGVLTWFEVTTFVRAVLPKIMTSRAAALGLFMLLIGRSPDRVKALILTIGYSSDEDKAEKLLFRRNRIGLASSINLPPPIGSDIAPGLFQPVENTIYLGMPTVLVKPLTDFRKLTDEDYVALLVDLEKLLKSINDSNSLRLTIPRLCGFLRSEMRRKLGDPAEASLICGETPDQCPALYYYALKPERIVSKYREWVASLFKSVDGDEVYPERIAPQNLIVGSRTQFQRVKISTLFRLMALEIKSLQKGNNKDFKKFHNAYMLYAYEILCLAVGYRAVVSPLENIDDFDLVRGLLWVSDKESHNGLAARTLPLPDIAIEVVGATKRHIERLSGYLKVYDTELSSYLSDSLSGDLPLFSIFDMTSGKLVSLRPGLLRSVLRDTWPFALNWQRHFMRTMLREKGVSGDIVNAWMGHSDFGEEALGPWSGLSIADIGGLKTVLQEILMELKIEVAEGWGRFS